VPREVTRCWPRTRRTAILLNRYEIQITLVCYEHNEGARQEKC
jgi:hypothetical protein